MKHESTSLKRFGRFRRQEALSVSQCTESCRQRKVVESSANDELEQYGVALLMRGLTVRRCWWDRLAPSHV